ncbi:MAG TPA: LuxR C-terminal-related transcriptional regulator [Propionibacteriaceae bacterium]|nr:LuxR C-terminal-related transcriptional regulator [Propionibacteriaceae bacterium]
MWEERAHRARRDIAALAASGLGVAELHSAAIDVVGRQVSTDLTCWATIDPDTLVISTMTNGPTPSPAEYDPLLAESEYLAGQPHSFAGLARRGSTMAKLSDMSADDRRRSLRVQTVWRPLGIDQELRLMFRVDGTCWGAAGMVRTGSDFTDRETDYLAAVAPALATATRLAVRSEAGHPATGRPAILVVGPDGALRAATPAAQEWRERLDAIAPGRFAVMMQVMASGARSTVSGGFRARVRDAQGQWASLNASPLMGETDDDVAVVIEPVSGDQLVGLLLAAYGLTPREREVCQEVMAGRSTADIAASLFISVNTVQDHLKSIFAKVAVRSRGELVARLRPAG